MTRQNWDWNLRARRSPGFGRAYICPGCGKSVPKERQLWYGSFVAHPNCRIDCGLCGEVIPPPVLGKPKPGANWCDLPVHAACKEAQK